jgi:anti-sigma regulatory factor (Ser/Thr protein kinase)
VIGLPPTCARPLHPAALTHLRYDQRCLSLLQTLVARIEQDPRDLNNREHRVDKPYASPYTDERARAPDRPATFPGQQVHQATGMVMVQLGVDVNEAVVRLRIYAAVTDQWLTDVACSVVERRLTLSSPTTIDLAGNVVLWGLGSTPGVSRTVRGHMSALVAGWGLGDDHSDSALYVLNELVDNAVDHAGGPLGIAVRREPDGVKIAVTDGFMDPPTMQPHNPLARRGRGLQMVEAQALSWGYSVHDFGKTVWAHVTPHA